MNHSIFVVVLNWNQWSLTAKCVESLSQIGELHIQVVVVDNGSNDGSVDRLTEKFGDAIVFICNSTNLGYAGGNNVGIRYALAHGATHIMLLNNDTIARPGLFEPLLQRLDCGQQIGVVTPKIYYMEPADKIWAAGGAINWWLGQVHSRGGGQVDHGQFDTPQPVDYATGCCLLARSQVFVDAGLLDEAYFAYFEDTDWCLRARSAGWQIWYEPGAGIRHWAGASSKREAKGRWVERTSPTVYYLATRNNVWFLRRHAPKPLYAVALFSFFLRHVVPYSVAFVVLSRWSKQSALWRGVRDGVALRL